MLKRKSGSFMFSTSALKGTITKGRPPIRRRIDGLTPSIGE